MVASRDFAGHLAVNIVHLSLMVVFYQMMNVSKYIVTYIRSDHHSLASCSFYQLVVLVRQAWRRPEQQGPFSHQRVLLTYMVSKQSTVNNEAIVAAL